MHRFKFFIISVMSEPEKNVCVCGGGIVFTVKCFETFVNLPLNSAVDLHRSWTIASLFFIA